jgi:hypothetical protein
MGKFDELLKAGMEINDLLDNTASSRGYRNEDRGRLFMLFLHASLEYHRSISLLIDKRLYGSAFAMQRVLYESVLRGLWIGYGASDYKVDSFISNKHFDFPEPNKMAKALDNVLEIGYYFKRIHETDYYKAMCGYTHTGDLQISRRFKDDSITWNYDDAEILEQIHNSNCLILMYMRFYIEYFKYIDDTTPFLNLYDRYIDKARKLIPALAERKEA